MLAPHREGTQRDAFNWGLIDELIPLGGMRIEDDVFCGADGVDNLSRPFAAVKVDAGL